MKSTILLLAIICACPSFGASNEYRVDLDSDFIIGLGGSPKIEPSSDEAEMYVCRFLLKKRHEIFTIRVYTTLPRDPLTRGTTIQNDGKEVHALGFRPAIASARIERRSLLRGTVTVQNHTLDTTAATAFDKTLVRCNFFELTAIGPWLLMGDESGESLTGELIIDGKTTIVRRNTGESLSASACLEALENATKKP